MSNTYTVNIENTLENTERQIDISSGNPMDAHKNAYMRTSRYEEIRAIYDFNGEPVYDKEKGFYGKF
tara:strand:- start:28 stop:228 length:201 start_codon:yes stop_codon:yes gene_type:complete